MARDHAGMHKNEIIFQMAVNFLSKIALRLERLFLAIEQACSAKNPIIHHYALKNVIEIIKLVEKPELKSRFVKELMRIEHAVNKSQTQISNARYARLFVQVQVLSHIAGRFGDAIHQDPFLQSIRLAQTAHPSDCELHAPQLLYWLERSTEERQANLVQWLEQLRILWDTVAIYLALLRDTAQFEPIELTKGFYQCSLPARSTHHLILIRMLRDAQIVPKIQIGHHGLSIRLCDAYSMQEVRDSSISTIDLAVCQL
ncbi:MAG TPA: cell division protein ZapD [Legionellaceae bacterium]|nr:cell division protein ZapD [Legionellaceae bacterium]